MNSITEEDEEEDAWGEDEDSSMMPALPSPMSSSPKNTIKNNPVAPPRPSMAKKLLKKKSNKTNASPKTSKAKAVLPGSSNESSGSADDARRIAALEQQLAKLKTDLKTANEAKEKAESNLADVVIQLESAEKTREESVSKVKSELEGKLSSLQADLDAKTDALGPRDAEIISLKEAASAAEKVKSAAEAAHAKEITALQSQLSALEKTNNTLKLSVESAERRSSGDNVIGSRKESKSVQNELSSMPLASTQMFSKEITRLNYELKVAVKDKEKALALVIDLVGKKRLVRYLDEHGREENALRALKKLVRRGERGSPGKHGPRSSPQREAVVPRADQGAWWSTRDLHEVSSARGNGQMSSGNSPETSQEFRSPQQYHNGSVDGNRSGGSSGKKSRSRGKQNRRSPRNREYNQLLQMAHERAVSQQAELRPPFVSTGRRQSLFSNMKGNGRVQNSRAVVEQAAREYSEVAGGDEFYY